MPGSPFSDLERRRQLLGQIAENSSRLAFSFARYDTTGWGEMRCATAIEFDCVFRERPFVSSSSEIDESTLVAGQFPRVTSGVCAWIRNSKGFYTGAWVYVVVDPGDKTAQTIPNYVMSHHFIFAGIAIKDLPDYALDI